MLDWQLCQICYPLEIKLLLLLLLLYTCRVMIGKRRCLHFFSALFHPFLFILAGNNDMHESSDEFKLQPDWTTDCGVRCP